MDNDEIERALDECHDVLSALNCPFTEWEQEFLDSVKDQYESRGTLSDRQCEILQKIWDKV